MTNAWGDVSNTKMFMVLGSNFVENHPGVVQWANEAFTNGAKIAVADPRRTRTLIWGQTRASDSAYAQIRPGTNNALTCGLMNYLVQNTSSGATDTGTATGVASPSTTVLTDTGKSWTSALVGQYVRLTGEGYDPAWRKITGATATTITFTPAANTGVVNGTAYEIWASPLIDFVHLYNFTDGAFRLNGSATGTAACDYSRSGVVPIYDHDGSTTGLAATATGKWSPAACKTALEATGSVYTQMKARMAHYTPGVAADVCGISVGEFNTFAAMIADPLNRPATIMYAMGGTQHSSAAQQLRAYCMMQLMLGNTGKNGSGINALRGIHNVQGSTDQGVLYSSMPGYSDVPTAGQSWNNYMNGLFGNDTGTGLQQVGFRNMMNAYFRQGTGWPTGAGIHNGGTYNTEGTGTAVNNDYNLLPQGNGYDHRTMFQKMKASTPASERIRCMFVLGQNPAVTEPNLTEIRQGLKDVDTLVVTDLYMSETATCDRGAGTKTILLPSCAHPEEAGTVTSSARMLYWRYKATTCKGSSKNDLWILLKVARALSTAGAFSHIEGKTEWGQHGGKDAYEVLYGQQYHPWSATGVPDFDTSFTADPTHPNGLPRYTGEAVAEEVFKQMAGPNGGELTNRGTDANYNKIYGALWIYTLGYETRSANVKFGTSISSINTARTQIVTSHDISADLTAGTTKLIIGNIGTGGADRTEDKNGGNEEVRTVQSVSGTTITLSSALTNAHYAGELVTPQGAWSADARDGILAKSRATYDPGNNKLYGRFGWAWLYNRHVFYNFNPCTAKTQPGSVTVTRPASRYLPSYLTYCETCSNRTNGTCKAPGDTYDYIVAPDSKARLFQHHKTADSPPVRTGVTVNYRKYSTLNDYDHHNATSGTYLAVTPSRFPKQWEPWETPKASADTTYGHTGDAPLNAIGDRTYYPLVLTTWRICWHFQGGPMTRNVPWLAELDPDPYIEINAADAYSYGISTGDDVYVHTSRANNCGPFKARVGTGTTSNQNTKQGVVGIPWHWGRQKMSNASYAALVEGASANEVCIDALEKNIKMPESKACLCVLTKTTV